MELECLALKDLTSPRKSGVPTEDERVSESDHKENLCLERRRSTPLKSGDAGPAPLPSRKASGPDLAHVTPVKRGGGSPAAEPWSPTANLKMLISAASPDIRDRELKKVLFRPIENETGAPRSPGPVAEEDADESQFEDETEKKPSRKQKSLGLLCQKFLALYPDYPPPNSPIWISLDQVAASLGVERRRIYDIVNVLESLMIVGRMAKNSYSWYGRRRLESMLKELQSRGREQGYHLQMEPGAEAGARDCGAHRDEEAEDGANGGGNRKDKSLRIMSQKFVMLFLVSKTQTVTLDAAAKILIEDGQDSSSHSKYKTKVRRLYDIANVLTSLGLINKVHVREERGRKPAFKWLGPTEFDGAGASPPAGPEAAQRIATQDLNRLKMCRHASFNIAPTSAAVRRQINSAPNSPRREHAAEQNRPVDYSRTSPVCRLQFGSAAEVRPAPITTQTPVPRPQPTLLMHPLHPGQVFTSSPPPPPPHSSSSSRPHCLAYLPSLSQPSVVMLYRAAEPRAQGPEGQRSPATEGEEARKRKREEEEDRSTAKKGLENCAEATPEERPESSRSPVSESQPSHYLYVPNNAGLSGLNFLLSSAHAAPGSVPALAVPYVLVPSSSLPPYPLIASPLRTQLVVQQAPATPERARLCGASTPRSTGAPEPMTPQTPKENSASASNSFFQTPATPANTPSAAPNGRRRGSAQRRLDVEQRPNM